MKKLGILFTFLVCSVFLSSSALAVPIDSYTLNFSAAGNTLGETLSDIDNVNELGFTAAQTFVGFQDNDNSGGISSGDTFDDYFAITIETIKDDDGNSLTTGTTYGNDYQLSLIGHVEGLQTTNNSFDITSIVDLGFYVDAGSGWTPTNTQDLSTYADGTEVETGTLVTGGGTNLGAGNISGTFDMIVDVQDLLHLTSGSDGEYFELDDNGNPFPMNLTYGIVDSNTDGSQDVNVSSFETYFNFDANNDFTFYETAWNEGSINKAVVPEPTTMLLFGTGLLGFAAFCRRKRRY